MEKQTIYRDKKPLSSWHATSLEFLITLRHGLDVSFYMPFPVETTAVNVEYI